MTVDDELLADLASLEFRPLDFAYWAFPWGEANSPLAERAGLEPWQERVLQDLQDGLIGFAEAWRIAVRSGHGVGKSALVAILLWWAISTKVDTRGRVTANTEKQLSRTLWPEVGKWHKMFIGRDLFKFTATAVFSADPNHRESWRIDAIPWSSDNPEAFAGLHNYGKRIFIATDEASAIDNIIWEVLDGATLDADTQIIWLATGNPTRNYGRFKECFEGRADEWHPYHVDSREVSFTNKIQINRAITRYGADSDYVKVRYLGEFPSAANTQLFSTESLRTAQQRPAIDHGYEPHIMSVDVARFGKNESVIAWRRGLNGRPKPAERIRGYSTIELGQRIAALAAETKPDALFIDEGGVGGGVVDFVRSLGVSCTGVLFGGKPSTHPGGIRVENKRAEIYFALREWIRDGGAIDPDEDLFDQLVAIEYYENPRSNNMLLVSKEDMEAEGIPSPDWADALAMTFAYPVTAKLARRGKALKVDYDPLSYESLMEGVN